MARRLPAPVIGPAGGGSAIASISAVVITLNEERNLDPCLRSVRPWCDEVVVMDMLSDDRTPEIARRYADVLLTHERVGFVEPARGRAFAAASSEWIVYLDADEIVHPRLARWIRSSIDADPPYDVALIPRVNVFLGRWIRSSNWWPGHPRLFRAGWIDASPEIHRGLKRRAGARVTRLPRDPELSMWHFSYTSLESLTDKANRYSTIEARQALAAGRPVPRPHQLFGAAVRGFWSEYVRRRGYRDGMAGLTYAIDRAYRRYLTAAKRWDETRAAGRQAQYDRMRERILSGWGEMELGAERGGRPTDPVGPDGDPAGVEGGAVAQAAPRLS